MGFSTFDAVRLLRTPQILAGRRKHADSAAVLEHMERHAFRPGAYRALVSMGIDPQYFYRADLTSPSVVIDIGGFKGEVAQIFVDLYGSTVYSFEPHPRYHAIAAERFADDDRVTTYPFGLGDADAILEMEDLGLGSTVYGEINGSERKAKEALPPIEVEIRDVAAVLDELDLPRIDYMKINIEGAEFDLLDRLHETGWNERVRYMLIQFHEWYEGAHLRRWKARRRLALTHDEVWNFPWIYELWCNKDQPHPARPDYSPEEMEMIRAALRASNRRRRAGSEGPPTAEAT